MTPEDQTYTFRDQLPEGTTYVEGSGPEGASVEDGVLTWEAELPTVVGVDGAYEWPRARPTSCANPFNGGGYVDLAGFGNPTAGAGGRGRSAVHGVADPLVRLLRVETRWACPSPTTGSCSRRTAPSTPVRSRPRRAARRGGAEQPGRDAVAGHAAGVRRGRRLRGDHRHGRRRAGHHRVRRPPPGGRPHRRAGHHDMQVFAVTGSRDLWFAYDNVGGPVKAVTIGAENADADQGSALVNAGDASAVIGDDSWSAAVHQGRRPEGVHLPGDRRRRRARWSGAAQPVDAHGRQPRCRAGPAPAVRHGRRRCRAPGGDGRDRAGCEGA